MESTSESEDSKLISSRNDALREKIGASFCPLEIFAHSCPNNEM